MDTRCSLSLLLMRLVELFCMFTSGKGAGLTGQERSTSGEGGGSRAHQD